MGDDMKQEAVLFANMAQLQRTFFECVRSELDDARIHPKQGPIMMILLCNEGLSQADLVRLMKVSAATIAVSIGRLEKLGFVKRKRNEKNQRANILALTEKGESAARQMVVKFKTVVGAALKNIEKKDIALMVSISTQMIQNMQSSYQSEEVNPILCTKSSNT